MPVKDSLAAATALVHGLTVVTQNRVGFEKAGLMPHRRLVPGYLPVSSLACPIVGSALHLSHSGAPSQIVAKSWLV